MNKMKRPTIRRVSYLAYDRRYILYAVTHPKGIRLAMCDTKSEAEQYVKDYCNGPYAHTLED